jgi:hypothetical protein
MCLKFLNEVQFLLSPWQFWIFNFSWLTKQSSTIIEHTIPSNRFTLYYVVYVVVPTVSNNVFLFDCLTSDVDVAPTQIMYQFFYKTFHVIWFD